MLTALSYRDHGHGAASDTVHLTYEARFLRRKTVNLASGTQLLINLPKTTSLEHRGRLIMEDGTEVEVIAAEELLLQVTGADLTRLAWHIGNRHTPCQIEDGRLLIQNDKVIGHMLQHLGATITEIYGPFTPEGGAYGHGRTHSHEHGRSAHHDH
ncbi:MAG: urease accessory protein UreE [Pseudomonadota bacterium]